MPIKITAKPEKQEENKMNECQLIVSALVDLAIFQLVNVILFQLNRLPL